MNDDKASAAYHPFDPPTPEVLEQAIAAGIGRGDSLSYDNTIADEQAEAEAGEVVHDAETSRTDADALAELRHIYSFEALADAAKTYVSDADARSYEEWRFGRTRELLGLGPITPEQYMRLIQDRQELEDARRATLPSKAELADRATRRVEKQRERREAKRAGRKRS